MRGVTGDGNWYRTVMKACALDEFLAEERSSIIIGSGAQKLSGGQKQRLALARAIAIRPAILLLDDALSAVDRRTQKALTKSLFGSQGLCRKLNSAQVKVRVLQVRYRHSFSHEADPGPFPEDQHRSVITQPSLT